MIMLLMISDYSAKIMPQGGKEIAHRC